MKNIKSQKGAISLFVILAMLFFLAFMLGVFSLTTRRNAAQLEAVRETAKIYASGMDANTIYDSMLAVKSDVVIPISTFEQLKRQKQIMESATDITENYTINGKLYTYTKNASYILANDIILDMTQTSSGIQGASDIAIYDYMLYNKDKYKINLNNYNIYYKLPSDGSLWKCVFYHDIGTSSATANKFTAPTEASSPEAGKCYTADKYSIIDYGLDEFKYPWTSTTNYEFLLTYSCVSGKFDITNKKYNRWRQANNPSKETVADGNGAATAAGYDASFTGANLGIGTTANNYWGGLTRSTATATYINGSVGHGNWFYSVGSYVWYGTNGMPTSGLVGDSARECLLFVRVHR